MRPLAPSLLLLIATIAPVTPRAYAQSHPCADPSPHKQQLIEVADGVRLEVLDWGGSGRPLVFLAGGGDTAHSFDDFAPKLVPTYRVYAITRRGFGLSGSTTPDNDARHLADDVVAVLDALHLDHPVLIGHSIGGAELSAVANQHPRRVASLVYLDAAYAYAFDDGHVPTMEQLMSIETPQPPPPQPADLASFHALESYYFRVLGFTYPDGELKQWRQCNADGSVGAERNFTGGAVLGALIKNYPKFTAIPAPTLAIFAMPHTSGPWADTSSDPRVRQAVKAYAAALTPLTQAQVSAFQKAIPTARVVVLPNAHHYVFLSNQADVLRELLAFLGPLLPRSSVMECGGSAPLSRSQPRRPNKPRSSAPHFSEHSAPLQVFAR
jgi:non-heme chloroperoxidase